ncbi:MAG: DPP IV N-terminal domain-containing protein [Gemmatimonadales bacterium]
MPSYKLLALFSSLLAVPCSLSGQASQALSLERIFASPDFFPDRFGPARWLDDNSYTTVEQSRTGLDLVEYDAATGARKILVSSDRLVPRGQSRPLRIEDYSWSPDRRQLLIFTNSKRVWRLNTRGDYWIFDLGSRELRQLGGDAPPSTLMFAKFSPDGTRVAYVQGHNIYVQDLGSDAITQLTHDGSTTTINGTFDWVYEEEFSLRDGFRWSPDGTRIAYWQLDATGVRDFLLINNTDSLYSFTIPVQYPKAGTTNSAARIGIVATIGGPTKWLDLPGDPRNNYPARMDWAANSDELVIQYLNRLQDTNRVMLGNAATGAVETIFTDRDSAWVDVVDDLEWMDGGSHFTWVSERDGWRRVYLISRDGSNVKPITPAKTDILGIEAVDESDGWLYYIASPENPTRRYLYRVPLDGSMKAIRLSPADAPGTHSYQLSPNGSWGFHTFSRFATPPTVDLVRLPSHGVVRTLADNTRLKSTMHQLASVSAQFFRIDIGDGVVLDGWMMKPHDFDPSKMYPVLFYVYGEPAAQTVLDRWGGSRMLWHRYLTDRGYVVMSLDNRGTPAPRGRDWRKIMYGEIGTISSADQANGVRQIVKQYPWVDPSRIAIWGWSGGGSQTLNAIFRYPDIYGTGMAVAPVADERYYDTIYQERYMGLPQDNPEGYRNGSPITYAGNLKGNLLLVHGTGDDNVHYQGTEALINKLIEHNKAFTMMAYPNRSHGIFEGRGTRLHLFSLLTRYLEEHVPVGGRQIIN